VRKPAALTHDVAATVPIAFVTAKLALQRLAGLGRGDRVLIHAAAGGVGLAAVQIAQRAGATIFATAGSAASANTCSAWAWSTCWIRDRCPSRAK